MTIAVPVATAKAGGESARIGEVARTWWRAYCDPDQGEPATRARLRRSDSPIEAATIPAALQLIRALGVLRPSMREDDWRITSALDLARVLAHIREDDPRQRPMQAAGWKSFPGDRRESDAGEGRPRLSEARFRRLLHSGRGEERVSAFARLIALLGGTVNVAELANDFWHWNDRTKRRWAFDYYAAGIATPPDSLSIPGDHV